MLDRRVLGFVCVTESLGENLMKPRKEMPGEAGLEAGPRPIAQCCMWGARVVLRGHVLEEPRPPSGVINEVVLSH